MLLNRMPHVLIHSVITIYKTHTSYTLREKRYMKNKRIVSKFMASCSEMIKSVSGLIIIVQQLCFLWERVYSECSVAQHISYGIHCLVDELLCKHSACLHT